MEGDSCVLVLGMQGVGKSLLVTQIRRELLPPPAPFQRPAPPVMVDPFPQHPRDAHTLSSVPPDRCAGEPLAPADAVEDTTPTIGVEMDSLTAPKPWPRLRFELREIGGVMVQLWPQYYDDAGLLLFVVDVSQTTQVAAAAVELYHTLGAPALRDTPALIFLNKTCVLPDRDRVCACS